LYNDAAKNKVVFLRYEAEDPPQVVENTDSDDYPLRVNVNDTLTFGEAVDVPADLVVLATGMEPTGISELVEHDETAGGHGPLSSWKSTRSCARSNCPRRASCWPVPARPPWMSARPATVPAQRRSRRQRNTGPRLCGTGSVRCRSRHGQMQWKRCLRGCLSGGRRPAHGGDGGGWPHGARAEVTPALCTGCGACVAVCPQNAIDINGWTLKQYEAMVDRIVADDGGLIAIPSN
jgi:heterodisulfide reductase subunit A